MSLVPLHTEIRENVVPNSTASTEVALVSSNSFHLLVQIFPVIDYSGTIVSLCELVVCQQIRISEEYPFEVALFLPDLHILESF